ncbi:FAD-dependent oxidoreductase [Actinophytocola sp.]|uniref:FAD-dependent oxidoreductase n=1 Tax=Actinophytocola sp. TaxID=1872138 RepID=UPI00389A8C9B
MHNEHVDVVVVGSGFGGSVTAYRTAAAGLSVVVLERGRAYAPGTFPRNPGDMGGAFWDPDQGLHGLYDVWSFSGCDSVVASGLGGGSLIYANVLLRKDEHWFVHDEPLDGGTARPWPVTRADLDPHYDAVEEMLGATPYPFEHPAYAHTPKTIALRDAATELGLDWQLPPLAVSFASKPGGEPGLGLPIVEPAYGNVHGAARRTCRLCGECDLGCNDGAKNSLDHTYLSAAHHHGADLRTLHEVWNIRQRPGGGYAVDYVRRDGVPGSHTIECDRLVLAAGTFGTTHLLLRSRGELPGLSGALGRRFSGNGDVLAFLLRARDRTRTRELDASLGPVITSAIRLPDDLDGEAGAGRGAYIEDGGHPGFVDWLVESADLRNNVMRVSRFVLNRLWSTFTGDRNISGDLADLFQSPELSMNSLPLLGMGRDVPNGQLRLRGGKLDVEWDPEASTEYFDRLETTMRRIADVLGAEYSGLPAWLDRRFITVHPLGGAAMGHHPGEGVCDGYGEVFGHPGLYIADGSAMPGPVGANPSLTIAALADRLSTRLLSTKPTPAPRPQPPRPSVEPTALSFHEKMSGFVVLGATDPRSTRRGDGERLSFELTIHVDDVDTFLDHPEHLARAEGWVEAACVGGRRPVEQGWFNLFAPSEAPGSRTMRYHLWFTDTDGRARTLSGWKDVHQGPITHMWRDTTTLYTKLLWNHIAPDDDALPKAAAGAGILRITPIALTSTMRNFRVSGPHPVAGLTRFGRFFLGGLWDVYGPG